MISVTALHARGLSEKNKTPENPVIRVTGVVRLVGNEPFTELVISGQESEWYIAKDERYMLHDLQHRTVTVEGEETVTELKFASGLPAGTRRELKKLRIISVE